jgi:peptide/nickel transport system substrate-binding protein
LPAISLPRFLFDLSGKGKAAVISAVCNARPGTGRRIALRFTFAVGIALASATALADPQHGIAMHGSPALPPDFDHLAYANPDAPKGGRITYAGIGTFDSLNPLIVNGTAPRGLWDASWGNNVWEALLVRNRDEAFSLYGLLAESIDVPDDRSWIEFTLRPEAKFSDGMPVSVDDVLFSIELLGTKGRPNYRAWYGKVKSMEKTGERSLRVTFNEEGDREIPLLIGLMPILPKHATNEENFDKSSLEIPVGSGPYTIGEVQPGRYVTLKRNAGYWAKDLPIKRGIDNFDEIRVEYYRDTNSYFEAFKKGLFDTLAESDPTRWASGYDFPAAKDGRVILDRFETGVPKGMNGFVLNTRRPQLADPKVREALTYFLDFEWLNGNLFFGLYNRTGSYFQGSELSALGVPADEKEKALLAPYPDAVRSDVMDGAYAPPKSDGSGQDRAMLGRGVALLKEAGYVPRDGRMVNAATGEPLVLEFLAQTRDQERLALAYQRWLGLAGITLNVRLVDSAQFYERQKAFDFDMMQFTYPASLSPGNEQLFRWSSESAKTDGSFNFAGASSIALDAMLHALISATAREDFVAAARALDRVLISGFYVVPLFHSKEDWVARWARVKHPEKGSLSGPEPTTWWIEE